MLSCNVWSGAEGTGVGWEVKYRELHKSQSEMPINGWKYHELASGWSKVWGWMYHGPCEPLTPQTATVKWPNHEGVDDICSGQKIQNLLMRKTENCSIVDIFSCSTKSQGRRNGSRPVSSAVLPAFLPSQWLPCWLLRGLCSGRPLPCQIAKQFVIFLISMYYLY